MAGKELCFAVLLAASAPVFADSSGCESVFNQLHAASRDIGGPTRDVRANLVSLYRGAYRNLPEKVEAAEDVRSENECLHFRFRSAHLVNFYTNDAHYLEDMKRALSRLEERKAATDLDREEMFRALIGHRRFDEARRHLAAHPAMVVEPVPDIKATGWTPGPSAFGVSTQADALHLRRFDLESGLRIVAVTHPLCAYSSKAMESFSRDEALAVLLTRTIWLAPVEQRLHLSAIRDWNYRYPRIEVVIARQHADWPMVDDWSTPVFYVLHDGRLLGKVVGWPSDGNKRALLQLVSKHIPAAP